MIEVISTVQDLYLWTTEKEKLNTIGLIIESASIEELNMISKLVNNRRKELREDAQTRAVREKNDIPRPNPTTI